MQDDPRTTGQGAGQYFLSGQPYASFWHPDTILDWDPRTDPDAPFNRSSVPLQPRRQDARFRSDSYARAHQGRVYSLARFAETSNNPSQGSATAAYYAFGFWQYVDTLVFWGGAADEGLILAPNGHVIDAAHRNGVRVYGNVFFPETVAGGRSAWLHQFVRRDGGSYPVADKLVEIADFYGFEGWFINQETPAGGELGGRALANSFRDFLAHARWRSGGALEFMWYDSMVDDGTVSHECELNARNVMFFHHGNSALSRSIFLDYGWNKAKLERSAALATGLERSPYQVCAGLDVQEGQFPDDTRCQTALPGNATGTANHLTSLALHRPDPPVSTLTDPGTFHEREEKFWSRGTSESKGIAHYIAESTPVLSSPFTTNFNTGHGNGYWADGHQVSTAAWNNLALQDVLPTYRWYIEGDRPALTASFDFTDAYEGATSILFSGKLEKNKPATAWLYQTWVPLGENTTLSFMVQAAGAMSVILKAVVTFVKDGNTSEDVEFDLHGLSGTRWQEWKTALAGSHAPGAGTMIARLGLRLSAATTIDNVAVRLGQLRLHDDHTVEVPPAPRAFSARLHHTNTAAEQDNSSEPEAGTATGAVRLAWKPVSSAFRAHHYEVYRTNGDGSRTFLGGTPLSTYFIPRLLRRNNERRTTLAIYSVTPEGVRSRTPAMADVCWT
ncbi:endo-beta-N-acetylglucosaminidase [Actinopolyspora mortivallis]|nr:hypothetical protein [Actinopolyspora mortivallis]